MVSGPETLRPALAPKQVLWFVAGWLCFAVGAIGALLPGIPTTGPMILALACFARSSPRFHDWLLEHRFFGPSLRRWKAHRLIPIRAKVMALSMMTISFGYVAFLSPLPSWAIIATGVLIVVGAVYILRCPHNLQP